MVGHAERRHDCVALASCMQQASRRNGLGASGGRPAILRVAWTDAQRIAYRPACSGPANVVEAGAGSSAWPEALSPAAGLLTPPHELLLVACCTQEASAMKIVSSLARTLQDRAMCPHGTRT